VLALGDFIYDQDSEVGGEVSAKPPMELDSGSIYVGEWNFSDERHGKGKLYWTDGCTYEGYWRHD
jgi:hypothetical protein